MFEKIKQLLLNYLEKQEKKKAVEQERQDVIATREHEITLKKLDVAVKMAEEGKTVSISGDDTLNDKMSIEQMEKSWKDEFIMVILFVPIIFSFIPFSQDSTLKGFEILNGVPEWYMLLVGGVTVAIYGLRGVIRVVSQCKKLPTA